MILESDLHAQRLLDILRSLLHAPEALASMGAQARTLGHPAAVQTIAQMVLTLAR
jgi:UDP-N-acetylglucosamine:LPS N-acetylglucosamine transferase